MWKMHEIRKINTKYQAAAGSAQAKGRAGLWPAHVNRVGLLCCCWWSRCKRQVANDNKGTSLLSFVCAAFEKRSRSNVHYCTTSLVVQANFAIFGYFWIYLDSYFEYTYIYIYVYIYIQLPSASPPPCLNSNSPHGFTWIGIPTQTQCTAQFLCFRCYLDRLCRPFYSNLVCITM